jgi:hypothetical protein
LKRIAPLLVAVFLLSSCIAVGDFGAYWDKGTVDQSMLGWWQSSTKSKVKTRVRNRAGTYRLDEFDQHGREKPQDAMLARTLQVGNYSFLMIKVHDAQRGQWIPYGMFRYKIEDNRMWLYELNAKKIRAFLARNYPDEPNILAAVCKEKSRCIHGSWVRILKLNKNVYKILSSIPDTKEFWTRQEHPAHKIP